MHSIPIIDLAGALAPGARSAAVAAQMRDAACTAGEHLQEMYRKTYSHVGTTGNR